MFRIKKVFLIIILTVSVCYSTIDFFPSADFSVDLGYFFCHKNKTFYKRFMFESEWSSKITLFSVNKKFSFLFNPVIQAGLGRSQVGLIFSPADISYGLITYGEFYASHFTLFAGLDHSCFHEVDKKLRPTIYWNKIYSGIESPNKSENDFIAALTDTIKPCLQDRISWSLAWSWYAREFFGLIETHKIMTTDIENYHDFTLDVKYAVFNYKKFVLSLKGSTLLGIGFDKSFYVRQMTGLESDFKCKAMISTVYLNYYKDQKWFNSRDKLLELGVRFSK